jgi:thiol-disulfide isomerase/thioredoxin
MLRRASPVLCSPAALTSLLVVLSSACAPAAAPLAPAATAATEAQSSAAGGEGTPAHQQLRRLGAGPSPAMHGESALRSSAPSIAGTRERCALPPVSARPGAPERILPDARVPDFVLASQNCQIFNSAELVGKRPFAVVFFASWCEVCEAKLPLLGRALRERADELTSVFVSLDDAAQWPGTEALLAQNGLEPKAAVAGRDFLSFSLGYDPFRSVPVVVIVGRSGRVVDIQIGVRDGDEDRLEDALDSAIGEAPLETAEAPLQAAEAPLQAAEASREPPLAATSEPRRRPGAERRQRELTSSRPR